MHQLAIFSDNHIDFFHFFFKDVELVAISNSTSLVEGETALLSCLGWGPPNIQITWAYNNQRVITNSALVFVSEGEVIQDERMFKHSVLQFCRAQIADTGAYSCIVSNVDNSVNSSTQLTVSGKYVNSTASPQ